MIIKGKGFNLRPYRKGDEMAISKHANDELVAKNLSLLPHPYTVKDAKEWIEINLLEYKKKNPKSFVLAIEIDNEVCGAVGFSKLEKEHKAELGYWLGRKYWGNGIMTEVVSLAVGYAFDEFNLRRVYAYVFSCNPASKRVLEKVGFETEGLLKKEAKKGDKFIDCYLLAKVQ